jgi:FkbM family methyltransferase
MIDKLKTTSPIVICDIGASPIDPTSHIDDLMNNTNSILYGFEANINEFNKLKQTENKKYFNYALGDGTKQILNICRSPGMTSFLKPKLNYLKLFEKFECGSAIIKNEEIKTKRLDDINLDNKIDFFKIDVQGLEAEIIENGKNKIENSLIIEIETSPIPLYENEKTFSYISSQLEKLNFSLHMFKNINTRCFKPFELNNDIYCGLNHILQLDCVFVKNLEKIDLLTLDEQKKLAKVLFFSYKSYDLVDLLLNNISKIQKDDLIIQYRKMMSSFKIEKRY